MATVFNINILITKILIDGILKLASILKIYNFI